MVKFWVGTTQKLYDCWKSALIDPNRPATLTLLARPEHKYFVLSIQFISAMFVLVKIRFEFGRAKSTKMS